MLVAVGVGTEDGTEDGMVDGTADGTVDLGDTALDTV
jgi:hypothetical protein